MEHDWFLAFVLPSLIVKEPFDTDYVALVPPKDPRVKVLAERNPSAYKLINGFHTITGQDIQPSVLIVREDSPTRLLRTEVLVDFRNVFAIASLINAWASAVGGDFPTYPLWSEQYALFPVTLRKSPGLLVETAAVHDIISPNASFSATPNPAVPTSSLLPPDPNEPLIRSLVDLWTQSNLKHRTRRLAKRVFRSMQLAYTACSLPNSNNGTLHDFGVSVALWVSAFEILAHPGKGQVRYTDVIDLFKDYTWQDPSLKHRRYTVFRSAKRRGTLAQKIYQRLYEARNAFSHGNQVTPKTLMPGGTFEDVFPLYGIAPVLYGCALQGLMIDFGLLDVDEHREKVSNLFGDPLEFALLRLREMS